MTATRAPEPSAAASPDAERLRCLCLALLRALDSVGGAVAPVLSSELVQVFGAGVGEVAHGLRRESEALAVAAAELRRLPAHYLSVPSAARALAELEAAQEQALQVADALDAVCTGALPSTPTLRELPAAPPDTQERDEPPCAPVPSSDTEPHSGAATRSVLAIAEGPARRTEPAEFSEVDRPTQTHSAVATRAAVPLRSETPLAAQVFLAAEAHRKRREFEGAEQLYTEALELDPRFGPALSRRGQVRLAQKALDAALADFDAALALDETAVEAWLWRGDAHAISGRLDEAIADYTRALDLCPDLDRARFNIVVAQRRKDESAAGIVPTGPTEDVPAETDPAPEPAPIPEPKPARAPTTGSAASKPSKQSKKNKQNGQLVVDCPHCAQVGEISWDRLGKVFACKACGGRFGVSPEGKAIEVVESPGGKWIEATKSRDQTRRRNRRLLLAGLAVAVLSPALGFAGWRAAHPPEEAPIEAPLPPELEARAELFARGWLTNDVRLMKRLTAPTHDKVLYNWYNRHRPPVALGGSGKDPPEGTQIEVSLQPGRTNPVRVRVRVSNPLTAPSRPPSELVLVWEESPDGWFFVPPTN